MELVNIDITGKKSLTLPWREIQIMPIGDVQLGSRGVDIDRLKKQIAWANKQTADGGPPVYFVGMGDYIDVMCVDLDSMMLTKRGWKYYKELLIGEPVLAYDGERLRWTPLRDVQVFQDAPRIQMQSKSFTARCTPNHNWVTRKRGLRAAADLQGHADNLIITALAEDGDSPTTADEAAIIGWLVTDGHVRWRDNFSILQTKPQYVAEIREQFGDLIRHEGRNGDGYCFDLRVKEARAILWRAGLEHQDYRDLPDLVLRLTHTARAAMLDAMLKAEGSFDQSEGRRGNWRFSQSVKNPNIQEAFRLLCVLEGKRLGISKPRSNGVWTPRILEREQPSTYDMTFEELESGPVWCPTTDYSTWVMRQGDQVAITGNSPSNREAWRSTRLYDSVRTAMEEKATELENEFLKLVAGTEGRWLGILHGHHYFEHEDGSTSDTRIARALRAPYLGSCAFISLNFNGRVGGNTHRSQRCVIWCHHGTGSGMTPHAPLTKLTNVMQYFEADIYLIGHQTKRPVVPVPRIYMSDHTPPKLIARKKILAGTGGFTKGYEAGSVNGGGRPEGSYVEQGLMSPVSLGSVLLKVRPVFGDRSGSTVDRLDINCEV